MPGHLYLWFLKCMEKFLKSLSLNKVEVGLFTFVFTLVGLGRYFAVTNPEYFATVYTVEDGLLENITVLFLLAGCFVCWRRSLVLRFEKPKLFVWMCFLLGALFFFGAGEEISWGQRIFDVETPEFFQEHNIQNETNIHNLVVNGVKVNKLVFGLILGILIAIYVLIMPLLYAKLPKARSLIDRFAIPLPRLVHILFYLALFIIVETTPSSKKGEVVEFGGAAIFVLIVLFPHNWHIFRRS